MRYMRYLDLELWYRARRSWCSETEDVQVDNLWCRTDRQCVFVAFWLLFTGGR